MLNTLLAKIGVTVAISAALAAAAFGIYWYISNLQSQLAIAEESIVTLNTAVETQQKTIDRITADVAATREASQVISEVGRRTQTEVETLRRRFEKTSAGKPRDIGQLALARPASIQRVVNNGSAEATRCMELASGSPRTDVEIAATKPSEINTLCPVLANPNYVFR